MKKFIQKRVLPSLMKLNAESLFLHLSRNQRLNVFYHGVVNQDATSIFQRHLEKNQFEQHIKYFKKKFNIVSMDEMFAMYQQNIIPDKRTITISFDDGYLNNLTNALPILERHNVKATFYISGICVENPDHLMWSDAVLFVRYFTKENSIRIGNFEFSKVGRYKLFNHNLRLHASDYIKNLPYRKREEVVEEMIEHYNLRDHLKKLPEEHWKLMNGDQIKQLDASPLADIGSHSHLHYNLANIEVEEAVDDMRKSKDYLSRLLGHDITTISYPDGSYSESVKNAAESLGYENQIAVGYRCASDLDDKRIINRWGISSTTTFETIAFTANKAFIKNSF